MPPQDQRRADAAADDGAEPDGEHFVVDIDEIVFTCLDPAATLLVVEWWTPAGGLQRVERA